MSDIAIKVNNLSKRYRIGLKEELHDTFMGALTTWLKSPINNYKRLKKLTAFAKTESDDDVIWALKDVSFEVSQGEVLGIIGENGAGKSTLLKILSRITEPTSGEAIIDGRVASLLEVGTGFHQELTGRENVYLNGTLLGMKKVEVDKKLDEIIDFSGVEKFIDTPVKRYSSGMRVRLAFAVAAHLEPEILLIDEVLAVGDTAFQKKAIGKMSSVVQEGRTVLFVSHNLTAVQKLCPSTIWINKGKIELLANSETVVAKYLRKDSTIATQYICQESDQTTENEEVKIFSICLKGRNKNIGDPITWSDAIEIKIKYLQKDASHKYSTTLQFKDELGKILFATDSGEFGTVANPQGIGEVTSVCHIPGHFFNVGNFAINLLIVKDLKKSSIRKNDIISFTVVHDSGQIGEWLGKGKGALRPRFKWKVEYEHAKP